MNLQELYDSVKCLRDHIAPDPRSRQTWVERLQRRLEHQRFELEMYRFEKMKAEREAKMELAAKKQQAARLEKQQKEQEQFEAERERRWNDIIELGRQQPALWPSILGQAETLPTHFYRKVLAASKGERERASRSFLLDKPRSGSTVKIPRKRPIYVS